MASNTNDRLRMLPGTCGKGSSGPVSVCTGTAGDASIVGKLLELVFSGDEGVVVVEGFVGIEGAW